MKPLPTLGKKRDCKLDQKKNNNNQDLNMLCAAFNYFHPNKMNRTVSQLTWQKIK